MIISISAEDREDLSNICNCNESRREKTTLTATNTRWPQSVCAFIPGQLESEGTSSRCDSHERCTPVRRWAPKRGPKAGSQCRCLFHCRHRNNSRLISTTDTEENIVRCDTKRVVIEYVRKDAIVCVCFRGSISIFCSFGGWQNTRVCQSKSSDSDYGILEVRNSFSHASDSSNDVAMGDHDTLGDARWTAGVHDDGDVRGLWLSAVYCYCRDRRAEGWWSERKWITHQYKHDHL